MSPSSDLGAEQPPWPSPKESLFDVLEPIGDDADALGPGSHLSEAVLLIRPVVNHLQGSGLGEGVEHPRRDSGLVGDRAFALDLDAQVFAVEGELVLAVCGVQSVTLAV